MEKKHRKYRIVEHDNKLSIVVDIETLEEHSCFRLYHDVGEEIYLYLKEYNIKKDRLYFEYSILNLYKQGDNYSFMIKKADDNYATISNFRHLDFFIPIYFLDDNDINTGEINLTIESLNVGSNKVFFELPEIAKTHYKPISDLDLEHDKIYMMRVVDDYYNKNDNRCVTLEYNGDKIRTILPKSLNNMDLDNEIPFCLVNFDDGTPALYVEREYLIYKLYKVGNKYNFTIKEKNYNEELGTTYWLLNDINLMNHIYYPNSDKSFNSSIDSYDVNDPIQLSVRGFTNNGTLRLVREIVEVEEAKYTVENLFATIGYADSINDYFFKENNESLEENSYVEIQQAYLKQYQEGENLWVFTYLSYLDRYIYACLDTNETAYVQKLLDIYIKIEKWILEGSDYLRNFSPQSINEIIAKAETKIEKYSYLKGAIRLIQNNEHNDLISRIKKRLTMSPYLSNEDKCIFSSLINISHFYIEKIDDEQIYSVMLKMIKHKVYDESDLITNIIAIESKIRQVRSMMLNETYAILDDGKKHTLEMLIRNQYLLIILYYKKGDSHRASVSSVILLRFLGTYYSDSRYIDLAIYTLINQAYITSRVHQYKDIFDLKYCDYERIFKDNTSQKLHCESSGLIELSNSRMLFTPANLYKGKYYKKTTIVSELPGLDLAIKSDFDIDSLNANMSSEELIDAAINLIAFSRLKTEINEEIIDFDKVYVGRIKSFGKKSKYCFISFMINNQQMDALFHLNSFNRARVSLPISEFMKIGDLVRFKIKGINDQGQLQIEGVEVSEEMISDMISRPQDTKAIIIRRYNGLNFGITETKLPIMFYDLSVRTGMVLHVRVDQYNSESKNFSISSFEQTDDYFVDNAFELWRLYLIETGLLEQEHCEGEFENLSLDIKSQEDARLRELSLQLVYCLEQRLNYIKDEKELIINYYFLVNIAGIIKHYKSYQQMNKLENLAHIIKYRKDKNLTKLFGVSSILNLGIERIINDRRPLDILDYIDSKDIEIPIDIGVESKLFRLKKLVETYNLFTSIDKEHKLLSYFKDLITTEFNSIVLNDKPSSLAELDLMFTNSEKDVKQYKIERPVNLGAETKYKEFKSSFFFSASSTPQEDIVMRTIAGFLNAYNGVGKLYIGVDNNGNVLGLQSDLAYLDNNNNSFDQYQNHIQSKVASSFPKIINAILEYQFHNVDNKSYLEITIPSYDYPVDYKGEFYQRQGVQTRILKGSDLSDFIINKQSGIAKGNLDSVDDTTNNNIITNLYIYDDRTFKMTLNTEEKYIHKVSITKDYQTGYLLMCYDNAYINKVEVEAILSKKIDRIYKNAYNSDSELIDVLLIKDKEEVAVSSVNNGDLYMKICDMKDISAYQLMQLKGSCMIRDDFDKVVGYSLVNDLMNISQDFKSISKIGRGVKVELGGALTNKKNVK